MIEVPVEDTPVSATGDPDAGTSSNDVTLEMFTPCTTNDAPRSTEVGALVIEGTDAVTVVVLGASSCPTAVTTLTVYSPAAVPAGTVAMIWVADPDTIDNGTSAPPPEGTRTTEVGDERLVPPIVMFCPAATDVLAEVTSGTAAELTVVTSGDVSLPAAVVTFAL